MFHKAFLSNILIFIFIEFAKFVTPKELLHVSRDKFQDLSNAAGISFESSDTS